MTHRGARLVVPVGMRSVWVRANGRPSVDLEECTPEVRRVWNTSFASITSGLSLLENDNPPLYTDDTSLLADLKQLVVFAQTRTRHDTVPTTAFAVQQMKTALENFVNASDRSLYVIPSIATGALSLAVLSYAVNFELEPVTVINKVSAAFFNTLVGIQESRDALVQQEKDDATEKERDRILKERNAHERDRILEERTALSNSEDNDSDTDQTDQSCTDSQCLDTVRDLYDEEFTRVYEYVGPGYNPDDGSQFNECLDDIDHIGSLYDHESNLVYIRVLKQPSEIDT